MQDNKENNPKFALSLNEAIITGAICKGLAYLIFAVVNWKLAIGFALYNFARVVHNRCGKF
jgi:hypothetical protein